VGARIVHRSQGRSTSGDDAIRNAIAQAAKGHGPMEMLAATAGINLLHMALPRRRRGHGGSPERQRRCALDRSIRRSSGTSIPRRLEPNALWSAISRRLPQDQRISEDLHSFGVLELRAKLPGIG